MYILGIVLLVFFAVIGLSVFIGTLIKAGMTSDTDGFILLIPSVSEENAEARIRSAVTLLQKTRGSRIICVCPKDHKARTICEKMKEQYSFLEIAEQLASL